MGLEGTAFLGDADTAPGLARGALRVESGFYEGLEWPLDRSSTVIGRGRASDLLLYEATISRAHALVSLEDGNFVVQDLGSTNGVIIQGERQDRARLSDGDEIRMGRLTLKLRMHANPNGGEDVS